MHRNWAFMVIGAATIACAKEPPPPPPEPIVRWDTVIITREVAPPLPVGTAAEVCLATGQDVRVVISAAGDTLIGPQRVSLRALQPGFSFAGRYAATEPWFLRDQAVTFERRSYRKFGTPATKDCDELKLVGEHQGVNLFTDATAATPFSALYVPVRPGQFQAYQTSVGRVRG